MLPIVEFLFARLVEDEETAEGYVKLAELAHGAAMPRVSSQVVDDEHRKLRAVKDRRLTVHQLSYDAGKGDAEAVTALHRMAAGYAQHDDYELAWQLDGDNEMTALPDWMVSRPNGLTAADYDVLPEEVSRRIEIVDGAVVVNVAPRRRHQHVAHSIATALEAAVSERLAVAINVDLRLRDVPLLNRRPDVVVYDASLPDDAVLRPEHCLLVVEVMSPGSVTADQADKPAEYASAGIEYFWRVENVDAAEHGLTVFRYRLDPTTRVYASAGIDTGIMAVTDPVMMTVVLADLQ